MQNDQLCVMQIILNLDIGGAQAVVRTLVEHLASEGCKLVVCAFRDGPLRHDLEEMGITVVLLPQRKYSVLALPLFIIDIVRIWRSLARLIRLHHVDIVQTHLLTSLDLLALSLLYTTDLQAVLWTFHSSNFELEASHLRHRWLLTPKRCVHRLLYRLASRWVSGVIAVSDQVSRSIVDVIGPIGDKITVIHNGVDCRRYGRPVDRASLRGELGLDADTRLITMVGTLKEVKGHRYVIEVMASIAPRYPKVHLLLVGDGELRGELQVQVRMLGLDSRVHFLGSRHDVPDLLSATDLFVLPSLWEGLSMALLEAMASSLPIVASEVSGTAEAIAANETGLLVQPGDVPELMDAVEQVLSDPAHAHAMGAAARRRVEAVFSAKRQAEQHLVLYHRLSSRTSG